MHGGVKVYRGAASAARAYVEADRSRVDDYYLAEGTGLARRFGASPDGVTHLGDMDGEAYELWVAGCDPVTNSPRGRLRDDANAVRFLEITVNGPKTWSLAAALHPEVATAYDAAQDRAAEQIIAWVAEHGTTRVGPRGRFDEAETQWRKIDELLEAHRLNDRVGTALFDALLGLRVTRPSYVKLTELDERTATRDLVKVADLGLLEARGERRGRHYVAGEPLRKIQEQLGGDRLPLEDPYPTLTGEIRRALP